MELQLKYLPEFTVAGVLGEGKAEDAPKWVLPLWEKSNREAGTVKTGGVWGIMGHPDRYLGRWDERGLYLAGREVGAETPVPEGWTRWKVPSQTYLVADCSLTGYGEIFGRVLNGYLPAHGLEMIGAAHEHYPDPENPEHVELWFPIAAGYRFCQSCGMPLTDVSQLGTDAKGEPEYDYCTYCRQSGAFTADCTMEQMIGFCVDLGEKSGMIQNREEASRQMQAWFPTLKRWKTAQ